MSGYTKLFNSILTSTIWCGQDAETKVIWITLLAMADHEGMVEVTVPALAKLAEVPVDKVQQVLGMLENVDPVSRSLDNDGRRLKRVNGGYVLLNYKKYRDQRGNEARKEYMRKYMRGYMRKRREAGNVKPRINTSLAKLAHADADAYTYTYIPEEGVVGGETTVHKISEVKKPKTQEPEPPVFRSQELRSQPRRCLMPECIGQARTGLPGRAALFCSEACYERAQKLDPVNFPAPVKNASDAK